MSSSTEVEEISSCGKSECFAPTPLSRRSSDLGSRRGSEADSRYSLSRKQSVVGSKKQGWMRLKNRFTNKSEGFYFELDSLSEYVQYYRYEHSETKDVTKNRIIGSFNLEGAFLSSEDRVTKKDEKYRIIVRTKRGRKYVLTVSTKTDRDEWKYAMERARDQARSPEAMLAEWNQQDECVRCILPDQINEESIENEIVAAEEDDIGSVTTASMTSTLAGEYPEYFSMYIQDMDGKKVQLRNVLTSKVNVLVMLRQFGCKLCRHAAGRLMAAKPLFDALGVNLVAVGNGSSEAAKAFAKEFKFTGKLYADEKRELYKALSCNQGFRYILFKKTIEAIYNAHKEGYRQGEPTGDELQLGGAFVISANGEMIHRQIERFAGEPLDVPTVVSQCKSFLDSCDKWSTKPTVPRSWEDVEDVFADQKLLKIPGTFNEDSLENAPRFHFEFGNPEVTPNVEIVPQIAYFNDNFFGKSHVTYLSSEPEEPTVGPICITIEKVGRSDRKAIIRTVEGDIRALIPVEHSSEKDALKWLKLQYPILDKVILSEVSSTSLQEDLLEYENKFIYNAYKFGILYAKDGQTENEIFQNGKGSEDFDDFLQLIGKKVLLRGFKHYKGGLDTKHDSSGSHSYFTNFKGNEVMFHVSTLLPNNEKDPQRVEKKRHIGNDVVVLIFKEGNEPFDPSILNSQFNHVFLVVRPEKDKHGKTQFRVATAAKSGVEPFEPFIGTPTYHKSDKFRDFLLTKMINGERTATQIQEFKRRETRTRRDLLREFVTTYNPQSSKSFSAFLKKIPSSYLQPVSQEKVKTPRVKELEKDENFKKLEGVVGAAQRGMGLYTVHEDEDDKVNLDAVLKVFKEIREASDEKNLETKGAVKTITVRRFGKRGACEIIKPSSFEQLLADGGKVLSMTATKARTIAMEEEIVDVGKIADDEVIFLTSAEEEVNYFGGGLSASQST